METRRRTRRVQVASSDTAVGTGVYAPSSVATRSPAADQAAVLSSALGFGGKLFSEQVKVNQNKDAAAGAQAALNAEFTDEELHTMEKSAAYVQGAQKVFAKQRIIEDAAAANEWYQAEFDKGAGLDELRHGLNEFWKSRYEGVSTGIAREIAPLMGAASDQIMTSHANFQAAETQQRIVEAQGSVIDHSLDAGTYDHEAFRSESNSLIGKDATNELIAERVAAYAERTLDESVWDRPEFAMLRKNVKFREGIADNIAAVRTARHAANESATLNEQGQVLAIGGTMADAGSSDFPTWMAAATQADPETGIALVETDTQSTALWARWYKARSAPAENSVNDSLWRQGNARAIPKKSDRDDAAMRDAHARATELAESGQIPEEDVPVVARAYLIERSVVNNHLPDDLKRELEVNPANSAAFQNSVELFDQFEAEDPDWIAENIDPNVTRNIRAYKRHLAETGDPEKALERTNQRDTTLFTNIPEQSVVAAHDDIVEQLQDGPLWFDTGIEDNSRLRGMIKEDYRYYVEGGMPPELAVEETVKNLQGRYTVVEGQLYRAGEWSNPAKAEEAVTVAKEVFATEMGLETMFGNPDVDDISVIPAPNKPGHVLIALKGPLQSYGSMTAIPIAEIEAGYTTYLQAEAALAEDRSDVEAERKAREALLPIPISTLIESPELHQQMMDERDRQWNALSPAQRDVLKARQRN